MNFFTGICQGFSLLFRDTDLKEHLWVAASVYFNSEASQGSTYFLGKYYSRDYLKVKIPHPRLFQGKYLFPGGSTYLLVNTYLGSNYFPVNNYCGVLLSEEYFSYTETKFWANYYARKYRMTIKLYHFRSLQRVKRPIVPQSWWRLTRWNNWRHYIKPYVGLFWNLSKIYGDNF